MSGAERLFDQILSGAVRGAYSRLEREYLDPPHLIGFKFASENRHHAIDIEFIFPGTVQSRTTRFVRELFRAIGSDSPRILQDLHDYICHQFHSELNDYYHRSDIEFLNSSFHNVISYRYNFSTEQAAYQTREVLREKVDEYYTRHHGKLPRPYFSLRDANRELPFWQARIAERQRARASSLWLGSGPADAEYAAADCIVSLRRAEDLPNINWYWEEPDRALVEDRKRSVLDELTQILLCRESTRFFEERNTLLDRIDEERQDVFAALIRHEQQRNIPDFEAVWYGNRPRPVAFAPERVEQYRNIRELIEWRGLEPGPEAQRAQRMLQEMTERELRRVMLGGEFPNTPPGPVTAREIVERITYQAGRLRRSPIQPVHMYWDIGTGSDHSSRSAEAEARGMKLLEENLTPAQWAQYQAEKKFLVKGGVSGDTYEIRHGYQMNVVRIRRGKHQGLCFIPTGNLCMGDTLLAQKLGIELDESEILRVARPFNV